MIHVGQNYLADALDSGAAQARRHRHPYVRAGANGILDDKGVLFPDVMAARRRGIIFDFGNGVADHFEWDMGKGHQTGLWPDTFSTDWNTKSKTTGVVDLPNVMSKFLLFGMPLARSSPAPP